jgi:hypothetical protein
MRRLPFYSAGIPLGAGSGGSERRSDGEIAIGRISPVAGTATSAELDALDTVVLSPCPIVIMIALPERPTRNIVAVLCIIIIILKSTVVETPASRVPARTRRLAALGMPRHIHIVVVVVVGVVPARDRVRVLKHVVIDGQRAHQHALHAQALLVQRVGPDAHPGDTAFVCVFLATTSTAHIRILAALRPRPPAVSRRGVLMSLMLVAVVRGIPGIASRSRHSYPESKMTRAERTRKEFRGNAPERERGSLGPDGWDGCSSLR